MQPSQVLKTTVLKGQFGNSNIRVGKKDLIMVWLLYSERAGGKRERRVLFCSKDQWLYLSRFKYRGIIASNIIKSGN